MLRKKKIKNKYIYVEEDYIHVWFSLTYASYVVLPRSILQSAPPKWQKKFVELMDELGRLYRFPLDNGTTYYINLRDDKTGRFIKDPLCGYERGRRYIKPNAIGAKR